MPGSSQQEANVQPSTGNSHDFGVLPHVRKAIAESKIDCSAPRIRKRSRKLRHLSSSARDDRGHTTTH
jgi:hypothetical protein